jgi:predicted lipoprotein with Yx(FWY)xxD motif
MRRFSWRHVAIVTLCLGSLAGCSSSSKPASSATTPVTSETTVSIGSTKLGRVLVNSAGRTLYVYDKDTDGSSKCTGTCATAWPPLVVTGKPTLGTGLSASMFSTAPRSDGTKQLEVNGRPLYTYTGDTKAGDISGQGLGDFFGVGPTGKRIVAGQ